MERPAVPVPVPVAMRVLIVVASAFAVAACGGTASNDEDRSSGDDAAQLAPAAVEFRTFPSITRMTPTIDIDDDEAGTSIDLEAARGEREGGQVVAWAGKGEPRVVLEVTRLVSTTPTKPYRMSISADHIDAYIEQAMTVERGSPAGRSGVYVDPLIPAAGRDVVLATDERLLAWIDVAVPTDAVPGTYVGTVRVRRANTDGEPVRGTTKDEGGDEPGDGVLARIPIRVKVHAARIPKLPTLDSHVGFDQSQLVRFEEVEAGSVELRDVTERYATLLANARLSIGDVGALAPGTLPGHRGLEGDGAYLERVFNRRGVASVRIPFYVTYPFEDPLGRDRAAAVRYLRAAARWARSNGWADRMYVFAFDEPDDADAGAVRELDELLREADPALRQLVTRESAARPFQGNVDIWAPNISPTRFRPADVARERRRGNETWWYPSITTWQPYPTLFIDELRPTPRALGWLAWRYGIDGFLYWTATHWHEVDDPYRDPGTYNETDAVGNGDGVLVYPGGPIGRPGMPVPSVRLLQLRDGIEDHDLLVLATCANPRAAQRLRGLARDAAPMLDRIEPTAAQVKALRGAAFRILDAAPGAADCRTTGP